MRRLSLLLAIVLSACAPANESPSEIKPNQASNLIAEKKVQILDVRTEKEWKEGHLEGATRIEIGSKNFDEAIAAAFDEAKPILVYCRSGGRSARAAKKLKALGFETVYDLDGGISKWTAAGKKVVK